MRHWHGRWHWYDLVLGGLALALVYPDKVVERVAGWTGRTYGWLAMAVVELAAGGVMWGAMVLLLPAYPELTWGRPLMLVGVLGVFRLLMGVVVGMFGFDD